MSIETNFIRCKKINHFKINFDDRALHMQPTMSEEHKVKFMCFKCFMLKLIPKKALISESVNLF